MNESVRLRSISKSFGAVKALEDVSLSVEAETMHAIVGENGAGKTTLMKILYGVLQPDEGTMELAGKAVSFKNSAQAGDHGIGMVSQHYGIIPGLSCLQNLILGREPGPILKRGSLVDRADQLASQMGFSFDWAAEASSLSPAGKQKLEILKLLWRNSRVMILDEPTAMLSPLDADALFESLEKLLKGGATVLLVTHRVPEVMEHCSRVTVMRGGKVVDDLDVGSTSAQALSALIIGQGNLAPRPSVPPVKGEPVLKMQNACVHGRRGEDALSEVTFELRSGEVLGIAGVDGNGQRELLTAVAGLSPLHKGKMRLMGHLDEKSSTRDRIEVGLRIVPEDRHSEAVIESWSLEENASLGLESLKPLARGPLIDLTARRDFAKATADRFSTKHGGVDQPLASLSGGNQQRLVAGRALALSPKLLVAFQPARGLDLGGTEKIYAAIREECAGGMAALVISFDLDELLHNCDRILILHKGRLSEPALGRAMDRELIGRMMVGAA